MTFSFIIGIQQSFFFNQGLKNNTNEPFCTKSEYLKLKRSKLYKSSYFKKLRIQVYFSQNPWRVAYV